MFEVDLLKEDLYIITVMYIGWLLLPWRQAED